MQYILTIQPPLSTPISHNKFRSKLFGKLLVNWYEGVFQSTRFPSQSIFKRSRQIQIHVRNKLETCTYVHSFISQISKLCNIIILCLFDYEVISHIKLPFTVFIFTTFSPNIGGTPTRICVLYIT